MLRVLLAERFKLASHKETRQRAGYALTVDKKGPKLKASEAASPIQGLSAGQVRFGATAEAAGIKGSMTIAALARYLSRRLDVPVEDLTGINGKFDIDVSWTPDRALEKTGPFAQAASAPLRSGDAASLPAGTVSVFTSVRDTLGLRLEPRKEQIEVVVIDHIERVPAEN